MSPRDLCCYSVGGTDTRAVENGCGGCDIFRIVRLFLWFHRYTKLVGANVGGLGIVRYNRDLYQNP